MKYNTRRHLERQTAVVIRTLAFLLFFATHLKADNVDYTRDIKPLLRERCYACHGALKQESGLRLDTGKLIRAGGDSGPVVSEGNPDGSSLLERIMTEDQSVRMPPIGKPLSAEEIRLFRIWIADGAGSPSDEQPESDPADHWAFKVPVRPAVPQTSNPSWTNNPIDAFLMANYERHGLTPADKARPGSHIAPNLSRPDWSAADARRITDLP